RPTKSRVQSSVGTALLTGAAPFLASAPRPGAVTGGLRAHQHCGRERAPSLTWGNAAGASRLLNNLSAHRITANVLEPHGGRGSPPADVRREMVLPAP